MSAVNDYAVYDSANQKRRKHGKNGEDCSKSNQSCQMSPVRLKKLYDGLKSALIHFGFGLTGPEDLFTLGPRGHCPF